MKDSRLKGSNGVVSHMLRELMNLAYSYGDVCMVWPAYRQSVESFTHDIWKPGKSFGNARKMANFLQKRNRGYAFSSKEWPSKYQTYIHQTKKQNPASLYFRSVLIIVNMAKSNEELKKEQEEARQKLEQMMNQSKPKNFREGASQGLNTILTGALGE